jgi:molybdopterin/thiamine biosynthesis adenylyltransferase
MEGQIAVCIPGKTKSLREMIGTMKDPEGPVPSVGAAVSAIASMEALEVLKIISGLGTDNAGKLITVDMKGWTTETVEF